MTTSSICTIFYSWQSYSPKTNRGFIEEALRKAAKMICADDSIKVEPRIDSGVKGEPGAPDIAAILDKADAIHRKRKETIRLTEEFLRSAFLEMFGDPVTNPKGWPVATLTDLTTGMIRNGLSPAKSGNYPGRVLTLSAITHGRFDVTAQKTAQFDSDLPMDKTVDRHDFLVCRGNGNLGLVGSGCFPDLDDRGLLFPDTVIALRINEDRIQPHFLSQLWRSRLVRQQVECGARTTNGTHKINQAVLLGVQLPLPPLNEQDRFSAIATTLTKTQLNLAETAKAGEILFSSLVNKAFHEGL